MRGGVMPEFYPDAFAADDVRGRSWRGVENGHASAREPDARIEHRVEEVDEEIDRDRDHRDEHDQVLHDRIIAPADRFHEEARDAGDVEYGLGDDQPAHQKRGLDAD